MSIAQSVSFDDTQTQTLLETGWVTPAQMQRLCIAAAAKLGWDYNLPQHMKISRTGQTIYLMLPDVAPAFLRDLQCGQQDQWLHATCYDNLRVVYLDEQTQMWISEQYAQQTRDLWIETQIGQPSSRIITLCESRVGPQVRLTELNEPWSTFTPSFDTVSYPVQVALFTWGSLWSHSDLRITGEVTGFLRLITCALLQKVNCAIQQLFLELSDNSAQTHWMPRIRTDNKGNKKVKRVKLKQQTVVETRPSHGAHGSVPKARIRAIINFVLSFIKEQGVETHRA